MRTDGGGNPGPSENPPAATGDPPAGVGGSTDQRCSIPDRAVIRVKSARTRASVSRGVAQSINARWMSCPGTAVARAFSRGDGVLFFIAQVRSEEHTSELQSLMRISYAVFCLKKKTKKAHTNKPESIIRN